MLIDAFIFLALNFFMLGFFIYLYSTYIMRKLLNKNVERWQNGRSYGYYFLGRLTKVIVKV